MSSMQDVDEEIKRVEERTKMDDYVETKMGPGKQLYSILKQILPVKETRCLKKAEEEVFENIRADWGRKYLYLEEDDRDSDLYQKLMLSMLDAPTIQRMKDHFLKFYDNFLLSIQKKTE
jgi:hypothetical protein